VNRSLLIVGLCVTTMSWSACGGDGDADCWIADHANVVSELHEDGQSFYLVHRVAGWHDKVEFYEVYKTRPHFDICGRSDEERLSDDVIDPSAGEVKDVVLRGNVLEVRYTREPDAGVLHSEVMLIRE
jgi:hypothetical protein